MRDTPFLCLYSDMQPILYNSFKKLSPQNPNNYIILRRGVTVYSLNTIKNDNKV